MIVLSSCLRSGDYRGHGKLDDPAMHARSDALTRSSARRFPSASRRPGADAELADALRASRSVVTGRSSSLRACGWYSAGGPRATGWTASASTRSAFRRRALTVGVPAAGGAHARALTLLPRLADTAAFYFSALRSAGRSAAPLAAAVRAAPAERRGVLEEAAAFSEFLARRRPEVLREWRSIARSRKRPRYGTGHRRILRYRLARGAALDQLDVAVRVRGHAFHLAGQGNP
jgi:hypothetical protein